MAHKALELLLTAQNMTLVLQNVEIQHFLLRYVKVTALFVEKNLDSALQAKRNGKFAVWAGSTFYATLVDSISPKWTFRLIVQLLLAKLWKISFSWFTQQSD